MNDTAAAGTPARQRYYVWGNYIDELLENRGQPPENRGQPPISFISLNHFPKKTYAQRWQIETTFSMLKRLFGSALRSRKRYAIDREIVLRVLTINLMIILRLLYCFQQSRTVPIYSLFIHLLCHINHTPPQLFMRLLIFFGGVWLLFFASHLFVHEVVKFFLPLGS